jgi:hypothetical protein
MTNYANWYAYYRTRNQAMKSSASRAFQSIGANFRVGYMTIKNTNFLKLDKFDATASHRTNWFNKLFAEQAMAALLCELPFHMQEEYSLVKVQPLPCNTPANKTSSC